MQSPGMTGEPVTRGSRTDTHTTGRLWGQSNHHDPHLTHGLPLLFCRFFSFCRESEGLFFVSDSSHPTVLYTRAAKEWDLLSSKTRFSGTSRDFVLLTLVLPFFDRRSERVCSLRANGRSKKLIPGFEKGRPALDLLFPRSSQTSAIVPFARTMYLPFDRRISFGSKARLLKRELKACASLAAACVGVERLVPLIMKACIKATQHKKYTHSEIHESIDRRAMETQDDAPEDSGQKMVPFFGEEREKRGRELIASERRRRREKSLPAFLISSTSTQTHTDKAWTQGSKSNIPHAFTGRPAAAGDALCLSCVLPFETSGRRSELQSRREIDRNFLPDSLLSL